MGETWCNNRFFLYMSLIDLTGAAGAYSPRDTIEKLELLERILDTANSLRRSLRVCLNKEIGELSVLEVREIVRSLRRCLEQMQEQKKCAAQEMPDAEKVIQALENCISGIQRVYETIAKDPELKPEAAACVPPLSEPLSADSGDIVCGEDWVPPRACPMPPVEPPAMQESAERKNNGDQAVGEHPKAAAKGSGKIGVDFGNSYDACLSNIPQPAPVPDDDPTPQAPSGLFAALFGKKQGRNRKKASLPSPRADDVQFRAAAPGSIAPGRYFAVKIMMYLDREHDRADREQQTLGEKVKAATSSIFKAKKNQAFRICLQSPDIPLEACSETLIWNGKYAAADMDVLLPQTYDKPQLRLRGRVYSGDAVLTDLKLILEVNSPEAQRVDCEKCALRSAFISYASQDREKVVARIQGIQLAAPDMDLFLDVENLRRGERWEPRIYLEISRRDLFYLFWSRNAAQSEWVAKELGYALINKEAEYIEPIPLESPDVCPPPKALNDRHFNDWTLRYLNK